MQKHHKKVRFQARLRISLAKSNSDVRKQEVSEERSGDDEARRTFRDVTEEKIDNISDDLRGDQSDGQPPSPEGASEPAESSR